MNLLRISAQGASLVLSLCLCSAEVRAPQKTESALRARIEEFYTLMVQKKYRAAERLVAPDSRESYYAQQKPKIKDFKVGTITWDKAFQKADVTLNSNVPVRSTHGGGVIEVNTPYLSHWSLEKGQWFWYVPRLYTRNTPFGTMKITPGAAHQSGEEVRAMIEQGPKPEDLLHGVKASTIKVTVPQGAGSKAETTLENSLPGAVTLYSQVVSTAGVSAQLSKHQLNFGEKATLTITRLATPAPPSGGIVYVRVEPTGQQISIAVE